MRLIINTANDELLIVLTTENGVFHVSNSSPMHHNETLLPLVDQLLKEHNLDINDIDEYGVVIGPGSFTGVRVGIATVKAFRDANNKIAKGINNLDYLFALAKSKNSDIKTVAIKGTRDSYFVATEILGQKYIYDHNLTLEELKKVSNNEMIGMFNQDDEINCFVVENNAEILNQCYNNSINVSLVPVYYQLSQAENDKLKRLDLVYRQATSNELDQILSIEKHNILSNHMSKTDIETALNDKNYKTFVAVVEDKVIGYVILQITDEINIESIAVDKDYRNLGIATKLIETAKDFSKTIKIDTISLEVNKTNLKAYVLYKKLGFELRRERKNYYADGSNCLEMILKIN